MPAAHANWMVLVPLGVPVLGLMIMALHISRWGCHSGLTPRYAAYAAQQAGAADNETWPVSR